MSKPRLILVGGFLGAGKTTLLGKAAQALTQRGLKVGLITNDQAGDLVDTEYLRRLGFGVREVAGGCFCCKFTDLVSASNALLEKHKPNVLIGEPVGSCTDLSATVLQPFKKFFAETYSAAPFTVVVDPHRLRQALKQAEASPLYSSVLYIFHKQLEEADIIAINKSDLLSAAELEETQAELGRRYPHAKVITLSALNNEGIEPWLDTLLSEQSGGARILDIDYDTYAEGEAVLGWLNSAVTLKAPANTDWKVFCLDLLKAIKTELEKAKAEIAHVKLSLNAPGAPLVGNLTSTSGKPFLVVQGKVSPVTETGLVDALLLLNARVQIGPDGLKTSMERVVKQAAKTPIQLVDLKTECFSPARPTPTHRFSEVIS